MKKSDEENKDERAPPKPNKSESSESIESRIILCPSCKKKIRIRLPLQGNKGRCIACSNSFLISMDEHGNLKAIKENDDNASKSNQETTAIANYFEILGITPSATPEEVREAYKRKIREYHPDRVSGLGEKLKQVADIESKSINSAYSALKSKGLAK